MQGTATAHTAEPAAHPGGTAPPRLNRARPLVGHMLEFGRNPFACMMRARRECGELAEFRLVNQDIVLMTGPEANEAFCRAPDEQLSQAAAYKLMTPIFGKGVVFDAPVDKLTQQLRMLMPALRDRHMRTYASVIADEVEDLIVRWGDEGEIDFLAFAQELTLYTSSHCLLGKEFRYEMTAEFARLYHDLEQGVQAIAYIFPNLPIPVFRRRDRARARLQQLVTGIIEKRAATGHRGEDALQTLIESTYADGSHLTPNEITGMLIATMFAGHHTSAGTAAWTLIELLRHPAHLARITAELDALFGADGAVTFQSLREIPHLEHAILEVLRLHPPLIFLLRKVLHDFHYRHYTVPTGKFVAISPAVSHRIPEIFPEPDRFEPARYAPPRCEDERPFGWIAFGGGRHKCTGNAFGLMQLKAIFAILLRRYAFELVDASTAYAEDYTKMVVQPRAPVRVRYRRRTVSAAERTVRDAGTAAGLRGTRVCIDRDLCQGHAACMGEAPEIFRVDEKGQLTVLLERPPADLTEKLHRAVQYCPTRAISIVEE